MCRIGVCKCRSIIRIKTALWVVFGTLLMYSVATIWWSPHGGVVVVLLPFLGNRIGGSGDFSMQQQQQRGMMLHARSVGTETKKKPRSFLAAEIMARAFGQNAIYQMGGGETTASNANNNNNNNNNHGLEPPNSHNYQQRRMIPTLSPKIPVNQKYIMFVTIPDGQGMGNVLNGLLAAHLLGDEFNRRVCVSTNFRGFHLAFQPVQEGLLEECALLPQHQGPHKGIVLFNFGVPPDECYLRFLLSSDRHQLLFFVGNTYPRWPVVPDKYFETLYQPRKELLAMLPWTTTPPTTVVHLRQPDPYMDSRKGLDDTSLQLLGQMLPRDTFLVTNRVEWYHYFETKYGWSHPHWDDVVHSGNGVRWGTRNPTTTTSRHLPQTKTKTLDLSFQSWNTEDIRLLQLFCDWYTIAKAKRVLHTHSDFSISAIHFMNIPNSQTIFGTTEDEEAEKGSSRSFFRTTTKTMKLNLIEESWRREGETPRLVDRTPDNLRLCRQL